MAESSGDSKSKEKCTSLNEPINGIKLINESSKQIKQNTDSVSKVNNLCLPSTTQISISSANTNSNEPKVLKLNSDAFILPSGNLLTVNGAQNNILNCYNNAPSLLVNKTFTLPTLILMQNNFVPINTVQHIAVSQQTQKLILPKQTIHTTKTTFINKKPISSVRLYKAATAGSNGLRKAVIPRQRRSRRSKGILVKYPKRKPPTKNKKREPPFKKLIKVKKVVGHKSEDIKKVNSCTLSDNEPSFAENSNVNNKTYPSADNMLTIPEIPTTGQLIDFFENTASRCMDNISSHNSPQCHQNDKSSKGEKSQMNSFVTNTFEHTFTNSINCAMIESHEKNDSSKVIEKANDHTNQKAPNYEPTSSSSSSLLKYVPSTEKNFIPISDESAALENRAAEKLKPSEKEIVGIRSTSKDLNLSLLDDKKHYEPSFDEFSNDLFTSLQVPPSGHNADSISPTAAFLQAFPLVSSGTNVDLLPEQEDDNVTTTTSTTILQIGNLESPPNMLFPSKPTNREASKVRNNADLSTNFSSYGTSILNTENVCKEKSCSKDITQPSLFNDLGNYDNQLKTSCTKDVSQNLSFYPNTTSSTSTFPSYNIFTKYNEFPSPVTRSYYSLCSQPFTTSKPTDSVSDFSTWMSSAYTPEESNKDKTKRDKCVSTFKSMHEIESFSSDIVTSEQPKSKKPKVNNNRPLVNWMTTPDLRNGSDICQTSDVYALSKEDTTNLNSYAPCNSLNNTNFNTFSNTDYYLENQNYSESQFNSCKLSYSSANPCSQTWVTSKPALSLPKEGSNVIIPSTLPTLVGDLALGNGSTFNNYDSTPAKKIETDKKKPCRNYCKSVTTPNSSSSFLSVTQLVDDKSLEKTTKKHPSNMSAYNFGEEQEKCSYAVSHRNNDYSEYSSKKNYSNVCKDTKQQHMKCKNKESIKYQAPRCVSKENKKDTRIYSQQNFHAQNKEVNPLSSKNSNYSAESLIGSSNQNIGSTAGYFPYENSTNFSTCSTNDYSKRRIDETESLTNVGYYGNSNYMYHNNFQSFNNYGFSNQCCNNYSSQIQTGGFQKKKDEAYNAKPDTAEWSLSSYNTTAQSDFSNNQKADPKCKQSFSNKCNQAQKNSINSEMYSKYYQISSAPSTSVQTKSNCAFNSACSFNQNEGQSTCIETNYSAPNYEIKSTRSSNGMNTNTVHSATTLTNFNLSTIFPEINDKVCIRMLISNNYWQ